MPLTAIVNGEHVYAPSLSDGAWAVLRAQRDKVVRLPCGRPGHLRISRRGTKHFYHASRHEGCEWSNESAEHLEAKRFVADALRETGWTVGTEQCGTGWRADVLATSPDGKRRVAFEIQYSRQSYEETVARQMRYREAGIDGVWLFGSPPGDAPKEPVWYLPLFALRGKVGGRWGVVTRDTPYWFAHANWSPRASSRYIDLGEFARRWILGSPDIRRSIQTLPTWESTLEFFKAPCTHCNCDNVHYTISAPIATHCGWAAGEFRLPPIYEDAAQAHLRAFGPFGVVTRRKVAELLGANDSPIANPERVSIRSTRLPGDRWDLFICPNCAQPLPAERFDELARTAPSLLTLPWRIPGMETWALGGWSATHWCLAYQGQGCGEVPSEPADAAAAAERSRVRTRRQEELRERWPASQILEDVEALAVHLGWHRDRIHLGGNGPVLRVRRAESFSTFKFGASQWTTEGMAQLVSEYDQNGEQFLWFVEDDFAPNPDLTSARVVPLRRDLTGSGQARYRVVIGPDEEMLLERALPILLAQ